MQKLLTICAFFVLSSAHANERSRAFENCLVAATTAATASTLAGDPNEAMDRAAETLRSEGIPAHISAMAANIEAKMIVAHSAEDRLNVRLWLKWIVNGIAEEPIEKFQEDARAVARAFEACILHVYDIDLTTMAGWQNSK